jgi:hypothetical protein
MSSGIFYSETNAYIGSGYIENTSIVKSSIDMNLENITSVKDPINPQDAATKYYVDTAVSSLSSSNVTLSGTSGTLISSMTSGVYIVKVVSNILNGPFATFNVLKPFGNDPKIDTVSQSPGKSPLTFLKIKWDNTGMFLSKTSSSFDGSYSIVLV